MTRNQLLARIKKHCKKCVLRCEENCPLYELREGKDPTYQKRKMSDNQLANLQKSNRRNGIKDKDNEKEQA